MLSSQCSTLSSVMNRVWLFQKVVDNSILVVNFFLRFLVIWLIKKMGYRTISEETVSIMRVVFII